MLPTNKHRPRIDAAFGCTELNSSHGVSSREYGNIILLHLLIMAVLVHVLVKGVSST